LHITIHIFKIKPIKMLYMKQLLKCYLL